MARSEGGYSLLVIVVLSGVLLVSGMSTVRLVRSEIFHSARDVGQRKAFYVAESGIQHGIAELVATGAAAVTTGYRAELSGSVGEGSYDVVIDTDRFFPADPARKEIRATGRVGPYETETVARVFVQPPEPCVLAFSEAADTRMVTSLAVSPTSLFLGNVHANGRATIDILAGKAPLGNGRLDAGGDVVVNSLVSLPAAANLFKAFYGGQFVSPGIHQDLGTTPILGLHFANGISGHGEQQPVSSRRLVRPDYDLVRRDLRTIVVSEGNVPFGKWDQAANAWVVSGTFSFAANQRVVYYVEGNASFATLSLSRSASATIVTRGWLAFQRLALATAAAGDTPEFRLIAEGDLVVGRQLTSSAPLSLEPEASAMLDTTTGLSLAGAKALSQTHVLGYSQNGSVWVKISSTDVSGRALVSLMGRGDTTLATNGQIASGIACPY